MMRRVALLVASALAAAGIAIVLVNQNDESEGDSGEEQSAREIPGDADPAEAKLIDEWATALRRGDVDGAARFFAIPSVAENGGTSIEISDLADARLFNAALPCGARLIEADAEGEFTVATFELTERPGPGVCRGGVGGQAMTAFVIEDGRIVEWRRVGVGAEDVGETGRPS